MSLVNIWKEDKGYQEGVELLKIYLPDHPMLPTLQAGESIINQMYLEQAINQIPPQPLQKKKKRYQKGNSSNPKYLYAKVKELYLLKIKRRNDFFTATTNQQRANINQDLIQYRKEIFELHRKINYFEETGELIKIPDRVAKKMQLPKDQAALLKTLYNTRSSISKTKKNLKKAYQDKAKRKIKTYEEKLKLLESKKIEIEQKIQHS